MDDRELLGQLMLDRLRQEQGFTLPELLTTLLIGLIVTFGGLKLVEVTMRRSGEVSARIEAVQSGRSAMDTITRELRSQVCLPVSTNPAEPRLSVIAASDTSVTMFTELRDTSNNAVATPTPEPGTISGPDKRRLTFAGGKLVEEIWRPTALASGVYTFAAAPTKRDLLESAEQALDADGNPIPVFQFFRYDFASAQAQNVPATPTYRLVGAAPDGALSSEQLRSIAKIKITYKANPAIKRADGRGYTVFTNEVFTRNVAPDADTDELSEPCK